MPNAELLGGGRFRVQPQWRRFTLPGSVVDTTLQVSRAGGWVGTVQRLHQPDGCLQLCLVPGQRAVLVKFCGALRCVHAHLARCSTARRYAVSDWVQGALLAQVSFTATTSGGACAGTAVICSSWGVRPSRPPPACKPFNSTGVAWNALACV